SRTLIGLFGRKRSHALSAMNLEIGEILPAAKLESAKPGKILLVMEAALADNIAALLKRFGHTVIVATSAADVFASFDFSKTAPSEKTPSVLSLRYGGASLTEYSLRRADLDDALKRDAFPDVVIGDMFSAGFAGFELQELLKSCAEFESRMIVLSPFDESKCVARAIQLGADDYLGLDAEPSVLTARIESSIERRRMKARRQLYVAALAQARESLEDELRRGAEYVRCLLPGKISGATLSTDWAFVPSASLGGDLFGYHRLGDGRMAIFMIDVSGHGVQSALYSVTILDALRNEGLRDVDFGDPLSVMKGLNQAFRMEERNNMLFTLWYGVWDEKSRVLTHASAGSPPAILIIQGGGAIELKADGVVAGADPDAVYAKLDIQIPKKSRLFLFSDGIYEFMTNEQAILGLEAFVQLLERIVAEIPQGSTSIRDILKTLASLSSGSHFQDDVSLLEVQFD
ncbi:MAG TPA: SpoIIE family protein phosphatase, partial [Rectinemataceae bacterium]|nr:SpoIIE family protein phosphatase [Rectinemataceae bacterium]